MAAIFGFIPKAKKAQGLSMNTIAVAALALTVLVVLIYIFAGQSTSFTSETTSLKFQQNWDKCVTQKNEKDTVFYLQSSLVDIDKDGLDDRCDTCLVTSVKTKSYDNDKDGLPDDWDKDGLPKPCDEDDKDYLPKCAKKIEGKKITWNKEMFSRGMCHEATD